MQGAFTGGGNNRGTIRDAQDHYELQNYTTAALGTHAINFGARLRAVRDANESTSGFNGNYIYPSLNSLRCRAALAVRGNRGQSGRPRQPL